MAKALWLILAVSVVVVALAPPQTEAEISCSTVESYVSPCTDYVWNGGTPPSSCCEGIRSLNDQASTTADRQAVCSCLKSMVSSATPAMINNAASLPAKCGVSIPYEIGPSTDCSTIQ
ncbi:hypothetical protein CDL12_05931 [Handroanthus impetiginosus]|uniref:Non-specific lipid-transfer protein n=1 Tax=Handroanthus impetiginosus TaxID=429701 RepID=A0A2G9HV39_9LAMI|nr:hypothetical protein CDL12_05931 [Handroanthus impetiginosus]